MKKINPIGPALVASSVVFAEVMGPHEPHIEIEMQNSQPQLVGVMSMNSVSTATATVQMWSPDSQFGGGRNFR